MNSNLDINNPPVQRVPSSLGDYGNCGPMNAERPVGASEKLNSNFMRRSTRSKFTDKPPMHL